MTALVQDAIVSIVAAGAAVSIVIRTRHAFSSKRSGPPCASCPSCSNVTHVQENRPQAEHPLHLIRPR